MSTVQFRHSTSDAKLEVRVEQGASAGAYQVHLNTGASHEVELHARGPGEGWLHLHGRVVPYYVVHRPSEVEVWIDGRRHVLEKVLAGTRRGAGHAAASPDIKAPMPGTVLKLLVSPGDDVKQHQPLVIMESMKMELTLSANGEGRVAEVRCREGELVPMGEILVRFEESATEAV
ncbi:MAG: hypothetical protein IT449_19010 [Phycisphaerales bacterium]|nr:hypothetical protein [Phycisphaerales bacterium]